MGGAALMAMGTHAAGLPGAGGMTGTGAMGGLTGAMGTTGQHSPMGGAAATPGYGPGGGGLFGSMRMGGDLFSNSEFELNREVLAQVDVHNLNRARCGPGRRSRHGLPIPLACGTFTPRGSRSAA